LGYASCEEDLAALRAAKTAVPSSVEIMADYNQGLSLPEAMIRGAALDTAGGLAWIEEPIRADDFTGAQQLAYHWNTPLMLGESFWGPGEMMSALATRACDRVMPDLMRIGGVTGWLAASALAHTYNIPMSSHLFPEVSAHMMAVTPTADWLEYSDWAEPILATPLGIKRGYAVLTESPGNGLEWDEKAIKKYAVEP
jgi:mandelate racemase